MHCGLVIDVSTAFVHQIEGCDPIAIGEDFWPPSAVFFYFNDLVLGTVELFGLK